MSDIWSQTSDVRCLNSVVRSLMSHVWCQTSDLRYLISDLWYQTSYITHQTSDIKHISHIRRLSSLMKRLTSDAWYMSNVWCPMSDVWYVWCMKSDVWQHTSEVTCLISDVWCPTSDVRCLISNVWCHMSNSGHLRHDYLIKYAYFSKCYLERFASISAPEKWTTNVSQRKKHVITRDIALSSTSQNTFS